MKTKNLKCFRTMTFSLMRKETQVEKKKMDFYDRRCYQDRPFFL